MPNIVCEYPAAQLRGVDSVSHVKQGAVPEQIKVINKSETARRAGRLEPGAQAEKSAETPCTTAEGGEGPANEYSLPTAPQQVKKF